MARRDSSELCNPVRVCFRARIKSVLLCCVVVEAMDSQLTTLSAKVEQVAEQVAAILQWIVRSHDHLECSG